MNDFDIILGEFFDTRKVRAEAIRYFGPDARDSQLLVYAIKKSFERIEDLEKELAHLKGKENI